MAKELSIFVDESGDRGGKARYYLLTLVFHDQADSIAEAVTGYEAKLARADLPNIPFHSEPLMNGHKINPSGRLSQNTRSAMLQLREEEWSEFFFWLLNSLECLDYVIINLTPESKKTLMSEHRNNIQVAIDALYSQRRRKSPGDESETLTRRNDAIFGNHVWQTFAQYFPPGLEKPSV